MGTTPAPLPNQQLEIAYYMELQRRIFDIFRYVSCHEANFGTYSIILESVLVDAGSFFDSECQTFIRHLASNGYTFKAEANVKDFRRKGEGKDNFNFADYRTLLESDFRVSTMEVNLNPYDDAFFANPAQHIPDKVNGYLLSPFKDWSTGSSSFWWSAFTDLKHDRLSNFRNATLGAVVHTMAAVFVILSINNESAFKQGQISTAAYDLFLPKYWKWKGRVMPGNLMWE
jgi:hypothetical protein